MTILYIITVIAAMVMLYSLQDIMHEHVNYAYPNKPYGRTFMDKVFKYSLIVSMLCLGIIIGSDFQ